jgi:hypothetical protein
MNIRKVLDEIDFDPGKAYTNGYNIIKSTAPYEVEITDKEGNSIRMLLANLREVE